ncbi:MAG: acetyl-CoA acetyltransferase [Dehalococcoidia bacterium]|jgi:acetyl-CoA acetyltransferase
MTDLRKTAAIVGVDESDEIGKVPDKSNLQHHAEAAHNALADAGLSLKDVDGLFTAGTSTLQLGEYLGVKPSFVDTTAVGGSSFIIHIAHAIAAIDAGYCDVALVTHGEAGRSMRSRPGGNASDPDPQYQTPYGFIGQPVAYSMAARRYMHMYGEDKTRQGMAEIAVATRKWALKHPKSYMKDEMSFDDYHNSRWIAWPFHLLDCCLVTDAGGAFVITSAERAKDTAKKPVYILGAAEGQTHGMISQMPDLTRTNAVNSGPKAMQMAGITHSDVDLAMIYDSFTYTVMATLESLGFCGPGEAADFVANQRTAPGGDFAMNTNGGGLSHTHSGMYGMFLILEAVRQLRGECGDRQIKDHNIALVNGTGGSLSSTGTTVLAVD